MAIPRRAVIFVAVFLATLAFDQGSKTWARTLPVDPPGCTTEQLALQRCHGVPQPVIAGFWDWELAMNDGVAFSSFRGKRIALSLLAVAALVMLGVMAFRTRSDERLKRAALGIIMGGALGNLVDRVRDGAVTDFVRWHAGDVHWPVFNVADVALVVGIALLLVESVLAKRRPAPQPA
ncbi:MAG: signal peptidase II [Kofleriaceae bacterium]